MNRELSQLFRAKVILAPSTDRASHLPGVAEIASVDQLYGFRRYNHPLDLTDQGRTLSLPLEIFARKLWPLSVNHLNEIATDELQAVLINVDRKKPSQRLLAAIASNKVVSQTECG